MLNDMLIEFIQMYLAKAYSNTVYSGYGTTISTLIDHYIDQGGSWHIVVRISRMAELKVQAMQ